MNNNGDGRAMTPEPSDVTSLHSTVSSSTPPSARRTTVDTVVGAVRAHTFALLQENSPSPVFAEPVGIVGSPAAVHIFPMDLLDELRRCDAMRSLLVTPLPSSADGGDSGRYVLRPLNIYDYDRGYIQLLAQLTDVGEISRGQFRGKCV